MFFMNPRIRPRTSDVHGLGVFALDDIEKGERLECSPVIDLGCFVSELDSVGLYDHYFDGPVIGLGYLALYNNDTENPNADCTQFSDHIEIYAIRDIKNGEEIRFNYDKIEKGSE